MIRYTVLGPFFTLLPCFYELRSTDNMRTIKKKKIYAIFLCFWENEFRSFSHFIVKAASQEETSIINIKIVRTCAIAYYLTTVITQSLHYCLRRSSSNVQCYHFEYFGAGNKLKHWWRYFELIQAPYFEIWYRSSTFAVHSLRAVTMLFSIFS